MPRLLTITILSSIAMLNGVLVFIVGLLTLAGNNFVYTPAGYGEDRVAIASLLGPLSPHAGWVLLCLGVLIVLSGYGLFRLKPWARYVLLATLVVVSVGTFAQVFLGFNRSYWGVIVSGVLKLAFYAVLVWYLSSSSVKRQFSGAG